MERREWAEQLLFGNQLVDKTSQPSSLTDQAPGYPLPLMPMPTRPPDWRFASGRLAPFPSVHQLKDPVKRGQALLTFANHELLAIEMMAFALLRFPNAPEDFRRDLCATIRDEQRHFKLYVERATELGASTHADGYSSFFWRIFRDAEQPEQFSAAMGMGIEQANLDHAQFYAKAFEHMGDMQSASIMKQVLMDEIQHVHRGVRAIEPSCPAERSLWDHWVDLLPSPLTPARARGTEINGSARLAAGLNEEFVLHLKNWAQTKGRPPNIWIFNPFFEERVYGSTPSKVSRALTADQEALPLFLASPHDAVLVSRAPSPDWLAHLRGAGLKLPSFIQMDPSGQPHRHQINAESIRSVQPWGWTPEVRKQLQPLTDLLPAPPPVPDISVIEQAISKSHAHRVCKDWMAASRQVLDPDNQWLAPDCDLGQLVFTHAELKVAAAKLAERGHKWAVIKRAFGTAGRGQKRIRLPLDTNGAGWFSALPRPQDGLRIEPWLDRIIDLSTQLYRDDRGQVLIKGHCHTLTSPKGQFWGAHIGPFGRSMGPDLRRFLFEDHRWARLTKSLAQNSAQILGHRCTQQPFGLDHFVYRSPEFGLRLRPYSECNPRWTMGRVALALEKLLSPGSVGLWLWQRKVDQHAANVPSPKQLLREPWVLDDDGRIIQGTVCTNDPNRSRLHIGVLRVEKTAEHCIDWFTANGHATPSSRADWPPRP